MHIVKDRYSLSIFAGSILVLLGFSIWLYAQSVVAGLSELTVGSTTTEEMYRYFGALRWWRLQQASLLNPIAAIFIVIGIILVANAFFWLTKRTTTAKLEYEI